MISTELGTHAFRYLEFYLEPGETLVTESGAMATMSPQLDVSAKFNGGLLRGVLKKFLGGESLFINEFTNNSESTQRLHVTSSCPGDIQMIELNNSKMCLEPGAYICSTPGVTLGLRYAGISSFLGREGLFKLEVEGTGKVWFGGYGAFIEKQIDGEYIVDTGHLVAYEPQIKLKAQLSSGLFGSFFSGEGLVTRIEGTGKVWLQTRSLGGLAGWVNPRI